MLQVEIVDSCLCEKIFLFWLVDEKRFRLWSLNLIPHLSFFSLAPDICHNYLLSCLPLLHAS